MLHLIKIPFSFLQIDHSFKVILQMCYRYIYKQMCVSLLDIFIRRNMLTEIVVEAFHLEKRLKGLENEMENWI